MAWIDGVVGPLASARVPVTDRGFLWGDHVFEIIRAERGVLCDGALHLARLATSAGLVRMPPPDLDAIRRAIGATAAAAAESSAAVRVMWTRGDGHGLDPTTAGPPRLVVMVEALGSAPAGVRLATLRARRGDALVPAAAKTGNYLASVLAIAAAADAGADDALLVDADGCALETATANLFVVDSAGIVTPTGAILNGVTAVRVAALLAAAGYAVAPARVSIERVRAAAELFVTSARRGPVPVVAIDGVPRPVGPVARAAMTAYAAWIASCAAAGNGATLI